MLYLASAFALGMLPGRATLVADPLDAEDVALYLKERPYTSIVGHGSTAAYMQARLGIPVEVNRQEVRLSYGDSIYVCQVGVRLQEGQVLSQAELEAIPVTFWVVTVMRQAQDR